jgi:hypothetical protein
MQPDRVPPAGERGTILRAEVGLVRAGLLVGWLVLLTLPPAVLWNIRDRWLADLDRPAIQAHWDRFRSDMKAQSDRSGPVQHKVPKSAEPPLRVWLRDYFWLAVAAWGVLGTTLYAFVSLVVLGLLSPAAAGSRRLLSQDEPGGHRDADKQDQRDSKHTKQ